MFRRTSLSRYEKDILQGKLFFVRNRLMGKYTAWRYIGNSYSSDDAYKAHILAFHTTQSHLTEATVSTYQRYEYDSFSAYRKAKEGAQYWLVLKPHKKNLEDISVVACFPCETTPLPSALEAVLERDSDRTGFPISLAVEHTERQAILKVWNEKILTERYKNETPEEKTHRISAEKDQQVFSEIANSILLKSGLFFLMPFVVLGSILLIAGFPVLGLGCIFGSILLYLFLTLLLIAFKEPLVTRKKRQMGKTSMKNDAVIS